MSIRSLYDDERLKLVMPRCCVYCGATNTLSVDHLIPRYAGGADAADNLVTACRSCNSAKGATDMLTWHFTRGVFPSLMLLRRYLKLVADYCDRAELSHLPLDRVANSPLPFAIQALPHKYPPLEQLRLWFSPIAE